MYKEKKILVQDKNDDTDKSHMAMGLSDLIPNKKPLTKKMFDEYVEKKKKIMNDEKKKKTE